MKMSINVHFVGWIPIFDGFAKRLVCFHLWFISGGTKSKWMLRFWINHEFHSSIAILTRPNRMQQKQVILGPFVICLDLKQAVLQVGMYQMCACPLLCCVYVCV